MTGPGLHTRGASRLSVASMNYKEQCEGWQQRYFQDVSSGWEGSLREDLVFVNATKPGWRRGMWDDLSLLSEMICRDQGDEEKSQHLARLQLSRSEKIICGSQGTSN